MKRICVALVVLTILLTLTSIAAVFPGAVATDADLIVARNSATTTLNGAINNSVTTFVLTSGTLFGNNMVVTIDSERIFCTTLSTATFSGCTRHYDGSTAASHSNGATVSGFIAAAHHNVLKDEIKAIESILLGNAPASGITALIIRGGPSQSTTNLVRFQENSDTYQGGVDPTTGFWTGLLAKRKVGLTPTSGQGFIASSDSQFVWRSADSLDTGSIDTGFARNAAGIVEVNNGTAGTYRDLKLRTLKRSVLTVSTLPGSPADGDTVWVSDSADGSCTTGSGSIRVQCIYNGTAWIAH